jgi:signal recognition particle receptor subunit beta
LESIDSWLGDLFNAAGKVPVVVVGNKADLEPAIPPDKIVQESESRGFKLITTSALENHNVNKAFTELLVEVVKKAKEKKTII